MPKIKFRFTKEGIEVSVDGAKGTQCSKILEKHIQALPGAVTRQPTDEMYQQQTDTEMQHSQNV